MCKKWAIMCSPHTHKRLAHRPSGSPWKTSPLPCCSASPGRESRNRPLVKPDEGGGRRRSARRLQSPLVFSPLHSNSSLPTPVQTPHPSSTTPPACLPAEPSQSKPRTRGERFIGGFRSNQRVGGGGGLPIRLLGAAVWPSSWRRWARASSRSSPASSSSPVSTPARFLPLCSYLLIPIRLGRRISPVGAARSWRRLALLAAIRCFARPRRPAGRGFGHFGVRLVIWDLFSRLVVYSDSFCVFVRLGFDWSTCLVSSAIWFVLWLCCDVEDEI